MSTRQFEFYTMRAYGVCKICEEQIDKGTKAVRLPDVHVLRNEKENKELDDEV